MPQEITFDQVVRKKRTPLNREQIVGFWAAWSGWTLDGMDSVIYALVLAPALHELLPKSGYAATPGNIGFAGSLLFAVFLIGWGLSYVWGPLADRFGRTKMLAATTLTYAIFTGLGAISTNVYELAVFRFLAGIGVGGEWALAGTYVAEAWPEDRRKMGAGYLQTGYYAGFFIAAALNFTVGRALGWRGMFLIGLVPVLISIYTLIRVRESERWTRVERKAAAKLRTQSPLREICSTVYRTRTLVNATLVTVTVLGLWASSIYAPTATVMLAQRIGLGAVESSQLASLCAALYSVGVIIGCLALPFCVDWIGRRWTMFWYFGANLLCIVVAFGWAFYAQNGLVCFLATLFVMGLAGGNAAMYPLWIPEQYPTRVRATAFSFAAAIGRFFAAGVSLVLGFSIRSYGSIGMPVAATAVFFAIGIAVLPFALETRDARLPE